MPIQVTHKYEYKLAVISVSLSDGVTDEENSFNTLGADGWELMPYAGNGVNQFGSLASLESASKIFMFRRITTSITVA